MRGPSASATTCDDATVPELGEARVRAGIKALVACL
jgi:hypothetical protein